MDLAADAVLLILRSPPEIKAMHLEREPLYRRQERRHPKTSENVRRDNVTATPLSIVPSGYWDGNDGFWSTFTIGLGTQAQFVRVLISTTGIQPWAVLSEGCTVYTSPGCVNARGRVFERNTSTTWDDLGTYDLHFEESLGYGGNGEFGYDTVSLGLPGSGAPVLDRQVIVGVVTPGFYVATWGIRPSPTNLTTVDNPITSLVSTLRNKNLIPSLTWGYTAGSYRHWQDTQQGLGSLTFGGSDLARYEPHGYTFTFGSDISRDLLVGIQSITFGGGKVLLAEPILSFIDAGVSHTWLPESSCNLFEVAFGLSYNATLDLYLVNDTQHTTLLSQNASITFNLGQTESSQNNFDIVLPYAAFDLELTIDYQGIDNTTRYFPIRRAANSTQYTLGRSFLQYAYVIADYERGNFSVYQARFPATAQQDLKPILPPMAEIASANSTIASDGRAAPISPAIIVPIAVAAVILLCLISRGVFMFYRCLCKQGHCAIKIPEPTPTELSGKERSELFDAKNDDLGPDIRELESSCPIRELECQERKLELAARESDNDTNSIQSETEFSTSSRGAGGYESRQTYELP